MDKKIPKEQLDNFLKDLSDLTLKHGIVISGCGCCGSPYLKLLSEGEYAISFDWELGFDYEKLKYSTCVSESEE